MDVATISIASAGAILFVLLAMAIPIGIAMGLASIAGMAIFTGNMAIGLRMPLMVSIDVVTTYGLIVVPMFLLMGALADDMEIAGDFFDAAYRWVGHIPGGLAVSTVVTCAGMAAISGSSVATAAAMARIALPELKKHGYNERLSIGAVTVGGTLAIMIPPSTILVIYALFAEQSIGRLLIAGILPGLLIATLYSIQVIARCIIRPGLGPRGARFSWRERFRILLKILPFVTIILAIVLGIILGIWTPVEAASVGVIVVIIIGVAYRRFRFSQLKTALADSVIISASIMVVIIGASSFSVYAALTGLNVVITNAIVDWDLSPFALFSVLIFVYVILGMFLEGISMLALTVPLLMPALGVLGWDPIWFGVIVVNMVEVASVTPPVGLNLYVVKAVAHDVPLQTIYLGAIPFWICNIIAAVILYVAPQIVLFLPNMMIGR